MSSSTVTLVLIVIAFSLSILNFFLYLQAKDRKGYAFFCLVSLNALLRGLRRQAATAERRDDVEFAALIARFEAAYIDARSALNRRSYSVAIQIVEDVGRDLALFRKGQCNGEKVSCDQSTSQVNGVTLDKSGGTGNGADEKK